MYDVTCSLVIYQNERKLLLDAIDSFLNTDLKVKLIIIDNSPTNILQDIKTDSRVLYMHNPTNPGFGASHNVCLLYTSPSPRDQRGSRMPSSA